MPRSFPGDLATGDERHPEAHQPRFSRAGQPDVGGMRVNERFPAVNGPTPRGQVDTTANPRAEKGRDRRQRVPNRRRQTQNRSSGGKGAMQ